MSVFMRLYIYSPWSQDNADHTILLATTQPYLVAASSHGT